MRLERVAMGDVMLSRIKGRSLWGEVTEVKDGIVYFSPISVAAGWRHASAREIIGHWRKTGRRAADGQDDDAPAVVPREQLSGSGGPQVTDRDTTSTRDTRLTLARHNLGADPGPRCAAGGHPYEAGSELGGGRGEGGPALPAPGELVRLPLPCPPQLIELSSYTGGAPSRRTVVVARSVLS